MESIHSPYAEKMHSAGTLFLSRDRLLINLTSIINDGDSDGYHFLPIVFLPPIR